MQPIQSALDRRAPRTGRTTTRPDVSPPQATPVSAPELPPTRPKKRRSRSLYAQLAFSLSAVAHLLLLLVLVVVTVQRHFSGSIMGMSMLATFAAVDEVSLDLKDVQVLENLPESDPEVSLSDDQPDFGDELTNSERGEGRAALIAGAGGQVGTTSVLLDAAFVTSSTSAAVMSSERNVKILSRAANTTVAAPVIRDLAPLEKLAPPGGKVDMAAEAKNMEATFFGSKAKGARFVFIVDRSGSMAGDRWRRARSEVIRCLEELGRGQSYSVILYSDDPTCEHKTLVGAHRRNVEATRTWLMREDATNGGTNPVGAIERAYKLEPDAIFLLSDGEFNSPDEVIATVKELDVGQTPIHAISFVENVGEGALRQVAKLTGGQYKHVD